MKLGQFESDGSERHWTGVVSDDGVVNLNESGRGAGVELPRELRSILGTWNWREKLLEGGDSVTVGIDGLGELTNPCQYTE
ncbi:hypothetical protein HYG81_06595 [Natrinema zhouii]|uniref:Uncharacterized protein n=1 Tax=Natrinema zhouii TaxID=1710539 RepID=A0A7D6H4M4_9EURY|nr:hypothetical protein [Natrinema zhouii]QLK27267.1 hypothetical protein HYG81_06595 [Natrinema zhouii]